MSSLFICWLDKYAVETAGKSARWNLWGPSVLEPGVRRPSPGPLWTFAPGRGLRQEVRSGRGAHTAWIGPCAGARWGVGVTRGSQGSPPISCGEWASWRGRVGPSGAWRPGGEGTYCSVLDLQYQTEWASGKESACNAGDTGSIPELGRSPGGMATHSSILAKKIPRQRSLVDYSPRGHKESDTTE